MMAGVIFVFSAAALLQFFISYCRSLIAASSKQVLSAEVKDVTGIQRIASGDDFKRVMQLLQLCPERPEDRNRSEEHTSELQSQSNLVCRLLLEKNKKMQYSSDASL